MANKVEIVGSNKNEIDVIASVWNHKWILFFTTMLFALSSVIFSLMLPNVYKAEALLVPVSSNSSQPGISSLAGQLGGVAALAGLSIGETKSDSTTLAVESLRSRLFIMNFVDKHNLKVPLMAAKDWDNIKNELIIDGNLYDVAAKQWVRQIDPPKLAEPSKWEVYETFNEILAIERESDSGLVKISVEHYSPNIASQWVELLVSEINQYVREKDLAEAKQSIDYLQNQANTTTVLGMQTVLYQLMEEQMKTQMLAEIRDEYAFAYVDPPLPPEMKHKPRRAIICLVGTLTGGLLSFFIILLLAFRKAH